MLNAVQSEITTTFDWAKVEQTTKLPARLEDFFERHGLTPSHSESRRAYHRFFLRSKAIVRRNDTALGVYSVDASRSGICFLSPIEMAINERVTIRLPKTKEFQIEIVRCRPLDDQCFECGAVFVLGK
jgi:hypothetical protein